MRGIARLALALAVTGLLVYGVLLGSVVAESWIGGLKLFGGSLLFLVAPVDLKRPVTTALASKALGPSAVRRLTALPWTEPGGSAG